MTMKFRHEFYKTEADKLNKKNKRNSGWVSLNTKEFESKEKVFVVKTECKLIPVKGEETVKKEDENDRRLRQKREKLKKEREDLLKKQKK